MKTLLAYRLLFTALVAALALLFSATITCARPDLDPNDTTDQAISRAVDFLVSNQKPNGSIVDRGGNEMAITSLAILALTAVGNQPGDKTREGEVLRKALDFVLLKEHQDKDGYFGGDGSRMYGHGITTLMLCEMLGMGPSNEQENSIRVACAKAIGLILRSQKQPKQQLQEGGWRYLPDSSDSDMSITVWQVMALRAAKNAGMEVPKEAIDAAVGYIKRSFSKQGKVAGFTYTIGGQPLVSAACEGLLALQVCGQYDAPEVKATADWLLTKPQEHIFFFYAFYYYAQGMYQRGEPYSSESAKYVQESLLPKQDKQGSWTGAGHEDGAGRIYSTSLAVLTLAVKFHYLPIYQR